MHGTDEPDEIRCDDVTHGCLPKPPRLARRRCTVLPVYCQSHAPINYVRLWRRVICTLTVKRLWVRTWCHCHVMSTAAAAAGWWQWVLGMFWYWCPSSTSLSASRVVCNLMFTSVGTLYASSFSRDRDNHGSCYGFSENYSKQHQTFDDDLTTDRKWTIEVINKVGVLWHLFICYSALSVEYFGARLTTASQKRSLSNVVLRSGFCQTWHCLPILVYLSNICKNCFTFTSETPFTVRLQIMQRTVLPRLWQNDRNLCIHSYTTWKNDYPSFYNEEPLVRPPLLTVILGQTETFDPKTPMRLNRDTSNKVRLSLIRSPLRAFQWA